MQNPEPMQAPEVPLTRQEKEKLLQQMYSLPHWIAIIRLFGYQAMQMDRARQEIKPIAEHYGKEPAATACEILVEISMQGKEAFARLKSHIRRMAFQILGPEPVPGTIAPAPATTPAPSSPEAVTQKPARRRQSPDAEGRPIKQPRHFVLKQFQAWLNEKGLAFVAIEDVKRTTPAVQPFISGLDFIVLRDESKLLVTVRPHLQAKHVKAMGELRKLFGSDYQSVRIWPAEGPEEWRWQEHLIDVPAE